jgi:hypothetical protein
MTDDSVEAAGSSLISARLRLLEAMAEHEEFGDAFMAEAQGVLDAIQATPDLGGRQKSEALHSRTGHGRERRKN